MTPTDIQRDIEEHLGRIEPDVEVLLVEVSGSVLRLFIDSPEGVDLGVCERVSGALEAWRDRYALEVSSPGIDRPLTRPDHFRRYIGSQVRVRTKAPVAGRRRFTGRLQSADETSIGVEVESECLSIPHESIQKSNLVPGARGVTR